MTNHILCCVDRSEAADRAIAHALALRQARPGVLTLLHVAPPIEVLRGGLGGWEINNDDPLEPPRSWLRARAAGIDDAQVVVLEGDPAATLAAHWAARNGVDVVVAASYNNLLARSLLGSFASELARVSPTDVLIARPGRHAARDGRYHHVGCGIDDTPQASHAVAVARAIAEPSGARFSLAHVVKPPKPLPAGLVAGTLPMPAAREAEGHELLARMAGDDTTGRVLLAGSPGSTLATWAERADVDLLVVGPRAGGRPGLGGVADHLAHNATCAVYLPRQPEDRPA